MRPLPVLEIVSKQIATKVLRPAIKLHGQGAKE